MAEHLPPEEDSVVTQCRLGRFQISEMLLRTNPTWVQVNIMPYMLVVRMQALISSKPEHVIHEVVAYSQCFESIAPGDPVPQYRIQFGDGMPVAERMHPATEQEKELSALRGETKEQKIAIAELAANLQTVCATAEKSLPPDVLAPAVACLVREGFL
jgi:hypothetical protein